MQIFIEYSDIASDLFLDGCLWLWWYLSSGECLATWLFWLETIPNLVPPPLHVIPTEGERSVTIIKSELKTQECLVPEKHV